MLKYFTPRQTSIITRLLTKLQSRTPNKPSTTTLTQLKPILFISAITINISNLMKLKLTPTLPISKQTLTVSNLTTVSFIKHFQIMLKTRLRPLKTLMPSKQTLKASAQTLRLSKKSNGFMVQRLKSQLYGVSRSKIPTIISSSQLKNNSVEWNLKLSFRLLFLELKMIYWLK